MIRYHVIFFVFIFIFASCDSLKKNVDMPSAKDGVLDLRDWDFSNSGNITLSGDWEFYWQELLTPQDFISKNIKTEYFFPVPGYWNDRQLDTIKLSGQSYATYRLKIISKENITLSVFIDEEFSAYKFWCDTGLVYSCGRVASNADDMIPHRFPVVKEIELSKDTTELVFQISNFNHRQGGFFSSPTVGLSETMKVERDRSIAIDVFMFGCMLILGLYHIAIFLTRKGMFAALFFGLFSIILSIRTLLTGSRFFCVLFPDVSWDFQYRLEYLTAYSAPILLIGFLYRLYPKDFNRKIINAYFIVNSLFLSFLFFSPLFFTKTLFWFYGLIAFVIVYVMYRIFIIVKRKRHGSKILMFTISFFAFTIISEMILLTGNFKGFKELISAGTFVLVLGQSLVFAQAFVQLFRDNEILKVDLNKQNEELEETVKQRTEEIERQRKSILEKNEELENHNKEIIDKNEELEVQKKLLVESESKMMNLIQLLPESIFEIDKEGNIVFANSEFFNTTGFNNDIQLNINDLIMSESGNMSFIDLINSYLKEETIVKELSLEIKRQDDSVFPILLSVAIADKIEGVAYRCSFIDITNRIADEQIMKNAYKEIAIKNKNITDSVNYALTIQSALMPSQEDIKNTFKEYFVINKPHSIVSGDFYFLTNNGNKVIFALSDCTGHGVPGGFMTMLGTGLLKQVYSKNDVVSPDEALNTIRDKIISSLNQTNDLDIIGNKDGMDMVLCVLDKETLMMDFASANQTVFICRGSEIIELKGDRMPVGIHTVMNKFTLQQVQLQKDDIIYFFSDGMVDVFGGPRRRRLYKKGLQKIILSCSDKPMAVQKEIIDEKVMKWQGDNGQIDDMLMFGIKV